LSFDGTVETAQSLGGLGSQFIANFGKNFFGGPAVA
jgi:hypothetical protein